MKIKSAEFIKGVVGEDEILQDEIPQIAFIGRSNVGKSSVINSLVNRKDLAKSSAKPGKTKEINIFLINRAFYLIDLPGYGFAKASLEDRENLRKLIYWYLFYSTIEQKKVVLIIDAKVGVTEYDAEILRRLEDREQNIIVIANKIDKLKNSEYKKSLAAIQEKVGKHKVIPYSSEKKIGIGDLTDAMLKV
jgi:GTP-binding protein